MKYVINIIVPLAIAFAISMLLPDYKDYYQSLDIPIPQIVFPIVWSILYVLMGIAKSLVGSEKIYVFQLFVNFMWTPIFFGLQNVTLALLWTILLLILVIFTFISFYKEKKLAGYLLIPYLLWVIFALFLTAKIWLS